MNALIQNHKLNYLATLAVSSVSTSANLSVSEAKTSVLHASDAVSLISSVYNLLMRL